MDMGSYRVLLVEDDEDILNLIDYNLTLANLRVIRAKDGEEAIEIARREMPDVILLDLMLPKIDGIDVCKVLKQDDKTSHIPIVMVTAKGEEMDRVVGLEIGAEDYIVKPFSPRELVLRIKAILKRVKGEDYKRTGQKRLGSISIDQDTHEVMVDGSVVELTPIEFRLLWEMISNPSHLFTREILLDRVWGDDCYVTERTVDTHVRRLRRKLGEAGGMIETIRGFGYRIKEG